MTKDLVAWLLEQIAEDERVIRRNLGHAGLGDGGSFPDYRTWDGEDIEAADEYLERFRPPRLLAECEAKRHRVDRHRVVESGIGLQGKPCCKTCVVWASFPQVEAAAVPYPCPTLRLEAASYADRPGCREEWRP